jgi:peptidoglycan hydrolase-like protein with peptidoglycan-binding domain
VQVLLNENLGRLIPYAPLPVDGHNSPAMVAMIKEFQRRVVLSKSPDGRVDPGGQTVRELHAGISGELTAEKLQAIMPQATSTSINRYLGALTTMMPNSQINTRCAWRTSWRNWGTKAATSYTAKKLPTAAPTRDGPIWATHSLATGLDSRAGD